MLDQSLLQSHFIGRDGFRWWIGQIPPASTMGKQVTGEGWGNRFKVRILGYHPYSEAELPNEDLPWAQCLVPTTAGTGAANCSTGVQLQPGDVVLGFFLDGDNAQIPVILAAFGRSSSVPSTTYKSPFEAFTGYDSSINKVNIGTQKNESNEQTAQPTPRDLSPEQVKQINPEEKSVSDALGSKIILADPVGNTRTAAIKSEISNLLDKIRKFQNNVSRIREEIKRVVDTISAISNDFVGVGFNYLFNAMIPILQRGLKLLYDKVFAAVLAATGNPAAAHLAGVAAQTAMVQPIKFLEENISELANKIVKDEVTGIVTDLLNSTIGNIDKFTSSVEEQFSSTLLNTVIDTIEIGLDDPLKGIDKLLQFFPNFTVGNTLRSAIGAIQSIGAVFDKNQSKESMQGLITEWMIGANPVDVTRSSFKKILDTMNVQKSGSKTTKPINVVNSEGINLGNLYTIVTLNLTVSKKDKVFNINTTENLIDESIMSPVSESSDELIKIKSINRKKNEIVVKRQLTGISTDYSFGQRFYVFSDKSDSSISRNTFVSDENLILDYANTISSFNTKKPKYAPPPKVKIFGGGRGKNAEAIPLMGNFVEDPNGFVTGSIIGFEITNPGSDYTIPPFVEVIDDVDNPQGYGLVARSVIQDGKVTAIYPISEGENYTKNENKEYSVVEIIIENPGENYPESNQITISDQFGNNYPVQTFEGRIISVKIDPLNNTVTDKPILTINSVSGSGAVLRALVGTNTLKFEATKPQKSVDCPI